MRNGIRKLKRIAFFRKSGIAEWRQGWLAKQAGIVETPQEAVSRKRKLVDKLEAETQAAMATYLEMARNLAAQRLELAVAESMCAGQL